MVEGRRGQVARGGEGHILIRHEIVTRTLQDGTRYHRNSFGGEGPDEGSGEIDQVNERGKSEGQGLHLIRGESGENDGTTSQKGGGWHGSVVHVRDSETVVVLPNASQIGEENGIRRVERHNPAVTCSSK